MEYHDSVYKESDFAVICSFLQEFGAVCGLGCYSIENLQLMLEDTVHLHKDLIDLHIRLLRKCKKNVRSDQWEKALIKFCHSYCHQNGWEIERFGYKNAKTTVKLNVLKNLMEAQFDYNHKFKNELNKINASELRLKPLGRDKLGNQFWMQVDYDCNIRIYKEDLEEESWDLVVRNGYEFQELISQLENKNDLVTDEHERSICVQHEHNSVNENKIHEDTLVAKMLNESMNEMDLTNRDTDALVKYSQVS